MSDKIIGTSIDLDWARSATKHRISHERSRYVIEHGDDENGIALEAMAVELESESLLVIHAMPLRDRHREQYEEAKKWQR